MVQQTSAPATAPVYQAAPAAAPKYALALQILRISQFVLAVVILGLVGDVVNALSPYNGCVEEDVGLYYDEYYCFYTPRTFYYYLFAAAWTTLITIYLIVSSFVTSSYIWAGHLVLDVLSAIIWFAAFIALAVWLGLFTSGFGDGGYPGLQMLEAADVFGALLWISFVLTMVFTILRRRSNGAVAATSAPMQQNPVQVAQHA